MSKAWPHKPSPHPPKMALTKAAVAARAKLACLRRCCTDAETENERHDRPVTETADGKEDGLRHALIGERCYLRKSPKARGPLPVGMVFSTLSERASRTLSVLSPQLAT